MDRLGDKWQIKQLPAGYNNLARDGSEIRHVFAAEEASVVHCTLPPRAISVAMRNVGINEIWCFIEGRGEVWLGRSAPNWGKDEDVSFC